MQKPAHLKDHPPALTVSLSRLFGIFFRLGATSYGGPLAGMATFRDEFVDRRGWISPARYAEILMLVKLLPGPSATSMGIQMGRDLGGNLGGVAAGLGFILPAFVLASLLFLGMKQLPMENLLAQGLLNGAKAGAWILIASSILPLARATSWSRFQFGIFALALVLVFKHPTHEALILLGAGFLSVLRERILAQPYSPRDLISSALGAPLLLSKTGILAAASPFLPLHQATLFQLFKTCFLAGAFTFGTGLAVLPVLRGEFVDLQHWLSQDEFLNAIVIGQITPGPVLITATVLGFMSLNWAGALAATVGAFLPAFLYGLVVVPRFWGRIKNHRFTPAFISGALPAVVGALSAVTLQLFPAKNLVQTSPVVRDTLIELAPYFTGMTLVLLTRVPHWLIIPATALTGLLVQIVL